MKCTALVDTLISVGNQRNGTVLHNWSEARENGVRNGCVLRTNSAQGDKEKLKLPSSSDSMGKEARKGRGSRHTRNQVESIYLILQARILDTWCMNE